MTDRVTRLYALVVGVVVFFVTWAAVAAHPWATRPKVDPRVAALAAREQRLHRESVAVKRLLDHRWAAYRKQLHARQKQIASVKAQNAHAQQIAASAPSVRVVTLPPITITRTS